MISHFLCFSLLLSILHSKIDLERYPTNGQVGEIRFFVPKSKLCRFNVSDFNLRFKRCVIPTSYGKAIPQILNEFNRDDLGMRKLHKTFCVKKEKQELGLFANAEIKADVGELTEKYPFSSFQRVICGRRNTPNNEAHELELEISRELGREVHETMDVDFQSQDEDIVEIVFAMQPTIEQKAKERRRNQRRNSPDKAATLDEEGESKRDEWIDDVVGGYFFEDQLDYSHIQDSSFVFKENASLTHKLSSIEARPILWMVLFEWKNPNHLDRVHEMNLHDLQMSLAHGRTRFEVNKSSMREFFDSQLTEAELITRRKKADLRIGRVKLNISNRHHRFREESSTKFPPLARFLRRLQEEVDQDN